MKRINALRAGLTAVACASALSMAAAAEAIPGFYRAPVPEETPGNWMLRSRDCRQSEDLEKALYECKLILQKSIVDGEARAAYLNRCAEIEVQLGRYDEAIADLEAAMSEDPPNRKYEKNLAIVKARAGRS